MNTIRLSNPTSRLCTGLALVGAVAWGVGIVFEPDRTWTSLLLVSFGLVGLGVGGAVFLAAHRLSGAGWATAIRRVPEAMVIFLPVGGVGVLLVLLARPQIYPWTNPDAALAPLMVGFKGFWLERWFFLLRAVVYLLAWGFPAWRLVQQSRLQDRDPTHGEVSPRASAAMIALFGVTFTLASFDWLMSLEPAWFSTLFGLYNMVGMFVAGLALTTLVAVWLRRQGTFLGILTEEHLHDLGKLTFGFSTVWAYLLFSQYMLIWYANLPEETGYYVLRREGAWDSLFLMNVVLNWVIPFVVLLPASTKRSSSVMAKVACVLLLGRWLDLYLMIAPAAAETGPRVGIWELGILVGVVGLVPLLVIRALRAAEPVAAHDPRLAQSLHYHS